MQKYNPKYRSLWQEIEDFIQSNWENSLIRSPKRLPYPFLTIAPNGREVVFYWDTYFTNIGLLFHKETERYALNNVNNLLFLVEQYGYVPNASEPWGLNRSQPPYLSAMIRDIYEKTNLVDKQWLHKAYNLLKKEYHFWNDVNGSKIETHRTSVPSLLRYDHHSTEDELMILYDQELTARLNFNKNVAREEKLKIASNYAAEAESGMDFTPRFEGHCSDFAAIDLNSNLYLYERNFAWIVNELGITEAPDWFEQAEKRKQNILKYHWNQQRNLFLDFDGKQNRHSNVATVLTFSPLFTKMVDKTTAEAVRNNLNLFEREWGLSVCEETQQDRLYQWGYPAAWSPMHFLVIQALDNYGFVKDAKRIAGKYCDLVAKNYLNPSPENYRKNGQIFKRSKGALYEKYNALTGEIFDVEYPADVFMGWTSGVFVFAYHYYLSH